MAFHIVTILLDRFETQNMEVSPKICIHQCHRGYSKEKKKLISNFGGKLLETLIL